MARIDPVPVEVESKPAAVDADPAAIPVRDDLPVGHWGKGKRLARVVWSGETDQVVVAGKLIAVRDATELAAVEAEAKPVDEKPTEEPKPVDEKPLEELAEVIR